MTRVITAIDNFFLRSEITQVIKPIGRDILYAEGIEEFIETHRSIEAVIISQKVYKENLSYLIGLAKENLDIDFIVLIEENDIDIKNIQKNIYFMSFNKFCLETKGGEYMQLEIDETNTLDTSLNNSIDLANEQTTFLESTLGKVMNTGLDLGLKAVLPDLIEDEVIDIKDAILENGFKEGIKSAISSGLNLGKSAIGIFTGKFENIQQVNDAVKSGGIIDTASTVLDYSIKFAKNKGAIDATTAGLIKTGKNTILNSISSKIEQEMTNQLKYLEKLDSYCGKWRESYDARDIDKMKQNMSNIKKYLEKVMPIETTIQRAREIENLHSLVVNNENFELTDNQKILAQKLAI